MALNAALLECLSVLCQVTTPNYTGNVSNSSAVNTSCYYCYLCHVYTSSCAWVWVHGDIIHLVSDGLFLMLLAGCANENITRCLNAARLNAGVWRTLFAWRSPGRAVDGRETLCRLSLTVCFSSPQVSLPLLSVIQLCSRLKMATLPKHTQWGICAVAQPPADSCKRLPLLQQRRPCTAVGWGTI